MIPAIPALDASSAIRFPCMAEAALMQAMAMLPSFPSLQELYLGTNRLTSLSFDQTLCPQLTKLKVPLPPAPPAGRAL